jgi:uncharacterized protein YciI
LIDLEEFAFVLLRRPADAPDLPEDELDRIQEEHLAHLTSLHERGVLLLSGPFRDQPDESLRGLCVLNVSVDEARALMADDPAVRAGRLAVDVMTWMTRRGSLPGSRSASS